MKKVNLLSKAYMRRVLGGYKEVDNIDGDGPGDPSGGDGNGNYMCCWSHQPTNCSRCVLSYSTAKCPDAGAVLTAC